MTPRREPKTPISIELIKVTKFFMMSFNSKLTIYLSLVKIWGMFFSIHAKYPTRHQTESIDWIVNWIDFSQYPAK